MSTALLDGKSAFYVYNMPPLAEYWEMQRKYIMAEVYRMKTKK